MKDISDDMSGRGNETADENFQYETDESFQYGFEYE